MEEIMNHDRALRLAMANGCDVFWYDGMMGPAWHCNCEDGEHYIDQQCSVVKYYKNEYEGGAG
jgi:hypothetical protein